MKALFDRIEILKIQFENHDKDVRIVCHVCQNNECTESTLIISFTDLNRVLSRLAMLDVDIDFSSFEITRINHEDCVYEFDAQHTMAFTPTLENFEMLEPYRQICA
jgi:hypothetical protein